ncbi:hypothetical protein TUM22923_02380 [Polynucleobacter sp. TUM22923]|jgi:hypothetical protein|uniref:DUF6088 family protein n=1 Tax=Polynucleobacter sp. TUM22923 TaxID=3022126 RepID=UPI00257425C9|nr:DUF6088 family protein [Polynucleobacter sp. TUM22923]BDX20917.1 hypothetical protein TUM22923_02380 [Polynucleobacter sp. TUM22923]
MPQTTVKDRVIAKIKRSTSPVFLRKEFDRLGDYRQVSRAVNEVTASGVLLRVGFGLYVKARASSLDGQPVPTTTLLNIGLEVMRKIGVEADIGNDAKDLREGRSTQVPMLPIINIGRSRVSRKIAIGKREIVYEKG